MKFKSIFWVTIIYFGFVLTAYADLTGTQKIKDHIDAQLLTVDIAGLSEAEKQAWLADPVRLNLNMLIPIYGSTILDNQLYGNIRPPAYIFDWVIGGFIPLGLILGAGLSGDRFSASQKKAMVGTAIGLYLITRVGVFIAINEHIHEYNQYMKLRLGLVSEQHSMLRLNLGLDYTF